MSQPIKLIFGMRHHRSDRRGPGPQKLGYLQCNWARNGTLGRRYYQTLERPSSAVFPVVLRLLPTFSDLSQKKLSNAKKFLAVSVIAGRLLPDFSVLLS